MPKQTGSKSRPKVTSTFESAEVSTDSPNAPGTVEVTLQGGRRAGEGALIIPTNPKTAYYYTRKEEA